MTNFTKSITIETNGGFGVNISVYYMYIFIQ